MTVTPHKANPPLIVDANAVLSLPVPMRFFQTIRRRYGQILQRLRGIENFQFAAPYPMNPLRQLPGEPAAKKFLCLPALEIPYHFPP
jgi:hypothetical protein